MGMHTAAMPRSSANRGFRQGVRAPQPGRRIPIRRSDYVAQARPWAAYERRERTRAAVRAALEVAAGVVVLFALWGSLVVLFAMAAASR